MPQNRVTVSTVQNPRALADIVNDHLVQMSHIRIRLHSIEDAISKIGLDDIASIRTESEAARASADAAMKKAKENLERANKIFDDVFRAKKDAESEIKQAQSGRESARASFNPRKK